jgi:hypothetical protein
LTCSWLGAIIRNGGEQMPERFPMPSSSWDKIKKIIQAYGAVQDEEGPTVESIAQLAGMHRPDVSKNNNFLREIGLVMPDQYKLTQPGLQLSMGISIGNQDLVTEALQHIVLETPFFSRLINILKARGTMKMDSFRGQLIMETGLPANSPALNYIRTLIDVLEESKLVNVSDDGISLKLTNRVAPRAPDDKKGREERDESDEENEQDAGKGMLKMPIPLGPGRTAFVVLPADWSSKDRGKLIKVLELALGNDEEN